MEIESRPELEELAEYAIESSAYQAADKNVEHAVSLLHAHATWYADDRAEIG
jgi:hypothetical protein